MPIACHYADIDKGMILIGLELHACVRNQRWSEISRHRLALQSSTTEGIAFRDFAHRRITS